MADCWFFDSLETIWIACGLTWLSTLSFSGFQSKHFYIIIANLMMRTIIIGEIMAVVNNERN